MSGTGSPVCGSKHPVSTIEKLPRVSLIPRWAGIPGTGVPLSATSLGPMVRPGISASTRSANVGWSRIACRSVGQPSTTVACSASMRSRAAPGSNRSVHSTVAPVCNALPRTSVPPIQKNGNAQKNVVGVAPGGIDAPRNVVARSTTPCVCTTPFGSALEPDV